MLDCGCDYDSPQVYRSRVVTAKKRYRCDECNAPIFAGERHEYAFGVLDGCSYQPRTCLHCVAIRKFVKTNIPCWCWAHGNMVDDARDIIEAAYQQAPDEVRGVAFGFGRLLIKRLRANAAKAA